MLAGHGSDRDRAGAAQFSYCVGGGTTIARDSTDADAAFLYRWAPVGTTVVVLR